MFPQHPSQRPGALHGSGQPGPDLDQRRDLVAYRILVEAWAEASAKTWTRRAVQLEDARPRRGDYNGLATRADLVARWGRLTAAADACRSREAPQV